MSFERRWKKVKEANFHGKSIFLFFLFFFFYIILTSWVNQFHVILPGLLHSNLWINLPIIFLNIILAALFGIVINLVIYRYKEQKRLRKQMGLAPVGVFIGIIGGMCPGCFAGLFPAIMGLFGVTATLGVLPLFGAEFLLVAIILMMISIWFLADDEVMCKIPKKH